MYNGLHDHSDSPLAALMLDLTPARTLTELAEGMVHLRWLLGHAQSLAAVCATAADGGTLPAQDLTQALALLQGYLEALRRVVGPWSEASVHHLTGQVPDAEEPQEGAPHAAL